MSAQIGDCLKRVVTTSLEEMVKATPGLNEICQSPVEHESRGLLTLDFGSSIPFKGQSFHGAIAVTCKRAVLEGSHPSIPLGFKVDNTGLVDWCGEITNLIIGRIKNQLSDRNIQFNMETPIPMPPAGRTFDGPENCKVLHLQYLRDSAPVLKVSFWIDLTLDDRLDGMSESADAGDVLVFSASSGDTILF